MKHTRPYTAIALCAATLAAPAAQATGSLQLPAGLVCYVYQQTENTQVAITYLLRRENLAPFGPNQQIFYSTPGRELKELFLSDPLLNAIHGTTVAYTGGSRLNFSTASEQYDCAADES